jgi:hypothetical protein
MQSKCVLVSGSYLTDITVKHLHVQFTRVLFWETISELKFKRLGVDPKLGLMARLTWFCSFRYMQCIETLHGACATYTWSIRTYVLCFNLNVCLVPFSFQLSCFVACRTWPCHRTDRSLPVHKSFVNPNSSSPLPNLRTIYMLEGTNYSLYG